MNYYLMNGDERLLEFSISNNPLGESIREVKSFSAKRPLGFTDISSWISNRNYAKHKHHFEKWLKGWGIDTSEGFVEVTHALGINDTLWVKRVDSHLSWSDVNLYDNQFTDVAQQTAFEAGLYGLELSSTKVTSPEFTSEGTCPKCWVKTDNGIYLYKAGFTGASNVGKEPYSEFISSQISKSLFPFDTIQYSLEMFKGSLCSKCKLFTNEEYGYVPFHKLIDVNRIYNLNDVLNICTDMGFEEKCRQMILIDSIVFNQDRHLGNFGFIVDNKTFQVVDFAPLFDFNISMLCNALIEDLNDFDKYQDERLVGHRLGGEFAEIGKAILTPELRGILPNTFNFPIHDKYNMDSERIDLICDLLEQNINRITGKKLYKVVRSKSNIIDIDDNPIIGYFNR